MQLSMHVSHITLSRVAKLFQGRKVNKGPSYIKSVHSVLFRLASPIWGLVLVYYYTGICTIRPLKLEDSLPRSSDYSVFDLRRRSLTKDEDFLSPRIRVFLTIFQLFGQLNCQIIKLHRNLGWISIKICLNLVKNPNFWSKLMVMISSCFYGLKTSKICILWSSDKIFVFGKNGPLIFDLRVKFLNKDI